MQFRYIQSQMKHSVTFSHASIRSLYLLFLFYLCRELCEAFSKMGYTSYEALTVRSWFRCVFQMFIDQPTGMLAKTDAERTVGKCSHFPNVCSNDSILQNWQTFSANYKMYFCLYSFTFT